MLVLKSSKVFADLFTKPEPKLKDKKLEVKIESHMAKAKAGLKATCRNAQKHYLQGCACAERR